MTEIERIEDQLKRSLEGEAWHGPALEELLVDVTAERAAAKPAPSVHSVWEIVLHIISTQRLVCERLQGKPTVLPVEEDWPLITDQNEAAWTGIKRQLREVNERLRQAIRLLDESRLEEPIGEGFSSIYVTLHGTVQHNLYHAGQIAVLKKGFGKHQTNTNL
jgi:uncharacterized damage-inducible protein DinB